MFLIPVIYDMPIAQHTDLHDARSSAHNNLNEPERKLETKMLFLLNLSKGEFGAEYFHHIKFIVPNFLLSNGFGSVGPHLTIK